MVGRGYSLDKWAKPQLEPGCSLLKCCGLFFNRIWDGTVPHIPTEIQNRWTKNHKRRFLGGWGRKGVDTKNMIIVCGNGFRQPTNQLHHNRLITCGVSFCFNRLLLSDIRHVHHDTQWQRKNTHNMYVSNGIPRGPIPRLFAHLRSSNHWTKLSWGRMFSLSQKPSFSTQKLVQTSDFGKKSFFVFSFHKMGKKAVEFHVDQFHRLFGHLLAVSQTTQLHYYCHSVHPSCPPWHVPDGFVVVEMVKTCEQSHSQKMGKNAVEFHVGQIHRLFAHLRSSNHWTKICWGRMFSLSQKPSFFNQKTGLWTKIVFLPQKNPLSQNGQKGGGILRCSIPPHFCPFTDRSLKVYVSSTTNSTLVCGWPDYVCEGTCVVSVLNHPSKIGFWVFSFHKKTHCHKMGKKAVEFHVGQFHRLFAHLRTTKHWTKHFLGRDVFSFTKTFCPVFLSSSSSSLVQDDEPNDVSCEDSSSVSSTSSSSSVSSLWNSSMWLFLILFPRNDRGECPCVCSLALIIFSDCVTKKFVKKMIQGWQTCVRIIFNVLFRFVTFWFVPLSVSRHKIVVKRFFVFGRGEFDDTWTSAILNI